jgi:hypothetical protein
MTADLSANPCFLRGLWPQFDHGGIDQLKCPRLTSPISESVILDPFHAEYGVYFKRFVNNSDEKVVIANAVRHLARNCCGGGTLLDLGAGDASLTLRIAGAFDEVVAVEKNPIYCQRLARIGNAKVIKSEMEKIMELPEFDMALFSYSLDKVPRDELKPLLERLFEGRRDFGQILYVTYENGCPWDRFIEQVRGELGFGRKGGALAHVNEVSQAGFDVETRKVVHSSVWGHDLPELAQNMAFFMLPKVHIYNQFIDDFTSDLKQYARQHSNGLWVLDVEQKICEICNGQEQRLPLVEPN